MESPKHKESYIRTLEGAVEELTEAVCRLYDRTRYYGHEPTPQDIQDLYELQTAVQKDIKDNYFFVP